MLNVYEDRNLLLASMGYPSYSHYLGGELWKGIRARVMLAGDRCRLCTNAAKQLHHQDYSAATLTGEATDALIPLCGWCHKNVEYTSNGNKRSFAESSKRCAYLLRKACRNGVAGRQPRRKGKRRLRQCKVCGRKSRCTTCPVCTKVRSGLEKIAGHADKLRAAIASLGSEKVQLTENLLLLGSNPPAGWSKKQLALFGVPWVGASPKKGWKRPIMGKFYDAEIVSEFLAIRLDTVEATGPGEVATGFPRGYDKKAQRLIAALCGNKK